MFPFADLFILLNLCLQTLSHQKICIVCLRSLNLKLQPIYCLEHTFFRHPLIKLYTADNEPLRHVIQRRLTFVYNLLFFLEESLIRLENEIQLDLEKAILNTIQMLRNAKLFPNIETLLNTSVEVEKQISQILNMIL